VRRPSRRLAAVALLGLMTAASQGQEALSRPGRKLRFAVPAGATVSPREAPAFGTEGASFYRVGSVEFDPDSYFLRYSSFWGPPNVTSYRRYAEDDVSGVNWYLAVPHLPGGAWLTSLELDDCDTNLQGHHVVLQLWDCDYLGECGAGPIASVSSENNAKGFQCGFAGLDLSALAYTVDNLNRQLLLVANLEAGDASNQLAGAILGYKLQVSPAPAAPTFNDVLPNHPQFQFIEALAASGITAGCGGGNYCPNNPLTRGQMAVFLAKALGLHWASH